MLFHFDRETREVWQAGNFTLAFQHKPDELKTLTYFHSEV